MTTVLDVARRAGVSIATVSRVLSGNTAVSEIMRERVLVAVKDCGFQPNPLAQGLRKGRGNTVALLVGDIEQGLYSTLTRHMQIALEEIGLDLMLYDLSHSADRLEQILGRADALRLRAIVIAATDVMPLNRIGPQLRVLSESGMSVISLGPALRARGVISIVHEESSAAAAATRYLLDRWGGPVAYIGRIKGSVNGTERFRGYCDALSTAGICAQSRLAWDASFRYAAGHETISAALAKGTPFRCVLAGSDEIALGAIGAIQDRGLRVPEDVAVMGFGNLQWGAYLRPALSTVSARPDIAAARVRRILGGGTVEAEPIARTLVLRQSA